MRPTVIIFLCLLLSSVTKAQEDTGIHFEQGLSFDELKAKAKATNKFLFIDFYTTWCVPCRRMQENIFPMPDVGAFFNRNFISAKFQTDPEPKESEDVRRSIEVADSIAKAYQVSAYPTFLIFSPEGELVHRFVGGNGQIGAHGEGAALFIANANKGLHPSTQYYTLRSRYESGVRDSALLKNLFNALHDNTEYSGDYALAEEVAGQYLNALRVEDMYRPDHAYMVANFVTDSRSKPFKALLDTEKIDAALGATVANNRVQSVLLFEYDNLLKQGAEPVSLRDSLLAAYPGIGLKKPMDVLAIRGFLDKLDEAAELERHVLDYFRQYGDNIVEEGNKDLGLLDYRDGIILRLYKGEMDAKLLGSIAKYMLENTTEPGSLANALAWSKRVMDTVKEGARFTDCRTYASLLYKCGQPEEAKKWMRVALAKAPDFEKQECQALLDRMG